MSSAAVTPGSGVSSSERADRRYHEVVRALVIAIGLASGCDFIWRLDPVSGRSDSDMNVVDGALGDGGPSYLCNLGPITIVPNIDKNFEDPVERADQRELYLAFDVGGDYDLFVTARADPGSSYPIPSVVFSLSSNNNDQDPVLTEDGLTILFTSTRSMSGRQVYQAERTALTEPWLNVRVLTVDTAVDGGIDISPDGKILYVADAAPGILHKAVRADKASPFGASSIIGGSIGFPSVAGDGLTVYYHHPDLALYRQTRMDTSSSF